MQPVLSCFNDQDSRVRYYACETLYNIVKVARSSVLPFFPDIFDALSKVNDKTFLVFFFLIIKWSIIQNKEREDMHFNEDIY